MILVVEDDIDISDAIVAALEDEGHSVLTAANGEEALELLGASAEVPRLILLDLMMPVMDGWQFRAAQRENPRLAGVPIVLLSADADVRDAAAQLGARGWLKKPVGLDALLHAVEPNA